MIHTKRKKMWSVRTDGKSQPDTGKRLPNTKDKPTPPLSSGLERRRFLELCGLGAAACFYPRIATAAASQAAESGNELAVDVAIIGGGLGGCAAALAAPRMGKRRLLTEPTDWIGGQLSQQGVPPDEHSKIETSGCTPSYREFRKRVRDYYRRNYPLTDSARKNERLNPGNGRGSPSPCSMRCWRPPSVGDNSPSC